MMEVFALMTSLSVVMELPVVSSLPTAFVMTVSPLKMTNNSLNQSLITYINENHDYYLMEKRQCVHNRLVFHLGNRAMLSHRNKV